MSDEGSGPPGDATPARAGASAADPRETPQPQETHPSPSLGEGPRSSQLDPSLGAKKADPWAHRRGEPRIFAFVWTVYLFLATAATMLSTVAKGFPGPEVMRPAARALLLTVALGVMLVWPVIRLSQARDRQPVSATVQDLFVVLIPVQAVVWPQTLWWLAHWPLSVVAAESAVLGAWALVVGGVIALALAGGEREEGAAARWGWMAGVVALVCIGAMPMLAGAGAGITGGDVLVREVRPGWMLSPFTAVLEVSRDHAWSGLPSRPGGGHWMMIGATALAAAPIWLAAIVRTQTARGTRGGRSGGVRGLSEGPAGVAPGGGSAYISR